MSLTQHVIRNQKMRQAPKYSPSPRADRPPARDQETPMDAGGLSQVEIKRQEKELERQLKEQMQVLKKLQDAQKDESGVRLDERQNLSIQRKRQIEKHRNRYVKEGIRHKTEAQVQMELQEMRKKKEALEAMQKTQERQERNLKRSRELSSTFMQQGLLKKIQSVDNLENRTNVASVEGSSKTVKARERSNPKPAIEVNVNSQTQNQSPQATHGSMSKPMSKVEKVSEIKSKGSGNNLRKFSATHNNQSGSPHSKNKHLSMGLNQQIGMSIQVNKTFQHHAGTTQSSKKEPSVNTSPEERRGNFIQQPDYMKLQNVSAQSRLVGDGGLRKLMRKGTNADLGDIGPQKQSGALHNSNVPRVKEESINIVDQKVQHSAQKQKSPYLHHRESLMDSEDPQRVSVEALNVNQLINQLQLSGTNSKKVQIIDQPGQGQLNIQPAYGAINTNPTDFELYQIFKEGRQNLEVQQNQMDVMQSTKQGLPDQQPEDHHLVHQKIEVVNPEDRSSGFSKVQIVAQRYAAGTKPAEAIADRQKFNQFIAFKKQLSETGPKKQMDNRPMPQFGIAPNQFAKMQHLPEMRTTIEHANSDLKDINSSLNKHYHGSENAMVSMQQTSESFLQDVKELKVSGQGQQKNQGRVFAPNMQGNQLENMNLNQNQLLAMSIGQQLNSLHNTNSAAMSPKPTKKILFQKQMNLSQGKMQIGGLRSPTIRQTTLGNNKAFGSPHSNPNQLPMGQVITQNERFFSIPERAMHEGASLDGNHSIQNQIQPGKLESGRIGTGLISPLDQSEHHTAIKHPIYAGMSERLSQVELMKQSLYDRDNNRGGSSRPPSDLKKVALQNQNQVDRNSQEQLGKMSLDGTGRDTILGGGMLSRTGGHERTLSVKKKDSSRINIDEQAAASHADNVEEQQLTTSAADTKMAFGHKKSNRSLERESNTLSNATPTMRTGLNNINPTSRNELYDAIEEESNVGRDTAEKNKARSYVISPQKDARNITPAPENNVKTQVPSQKQGLNGSDNSPAQQQTISPLLNQKGENQSALAKHPTVSDGHGSKLQQMNQTPLGTVIGHKSQNKTPANPTPNTKKDDMSNIRKDQFNASMYNISPIEVYIENRSAAHPNVFNLAQIRHPQSTTQKASKKQQPATNSNQTSDLSPNLQVVKLSAQNTQANPSKPLELEGQMASNFSLKRASQVPQASNIGNLNNPYLSYYKKRQESIHNKSQAVTQKNIQFNKPATSTPGMKNAGVQKDNERSSPQRSNNTDVSPITDKSGTVKQDNERNTLGNEANSRKAVSNLNLEPKYKSSGEHQEGGIRVGAHFLANSGSHPQRKDANISTTQNTSYLIKQAEMQASMELHELQEQTAEDNMSFQDGINKIQKSPIGAKKPQIDLSKYGISNKQQKYIDSLVRNFSLYQAQGTKEVEKMLQFLYSKNQLSNTYEVLSEISRLKNKQILKTQGSNIKMIQPEEVREWHDLLRTNPDVIALNLDKQTQQEIIETLTTLTKYEQEGQVHREHLYLQNDAIKGKRNYEELYYRKRSLQNQHTFLAMLEEKMARVEGKKNQDLHPKDNLKPKYLDDEEQIKRRRQALTDLDYIKMQFANKRDGVKVPRTRLEALLEKQNIIANSGGQQSIQIENTIEDETNQKIEDDNQIQVRLQKLLDKCLYFTSSAIQRKKKSLPLELKPERPDRLARAGNTLTQGWEAWETETQTADPGRTVIRDIEKTKLKSQESERDYEIRMNPVLTKDEVLPEEDELLQTIKERYLGIDEEHTRRWKSKYQFLGRQNLQEVYISEQLDPSDRLDQAFSAAGQQSMVQSVQYDVHSLEQPYDQMNPFDLPRNKLITSNSKVSLSPSNIMPGGAFRDRDIRRRHKFIKPKKMTKHHSKQTLEAGLQRNLSQKTIATLMTVQEIDYSRKREIKKQEILKKVQKEKEEDAETKFETKKENVASEKQYGRLLEDQNCVLPSLFDEALAKIVSPESELIADPASKLLKKHEDGGQFSTQVKAMITTQTLNLSNLRKLDRQAMREKNRSLTQQRLKQWQFSAKTLQPSSPDPRGTAPLVQSADFIKDLGETKRLQAFSESITGPDPQAPQTALYYRKDLSFLDKKLPEIKLPPKMQPRFASPLVPSTTMKNSPSSATLHDGSSLFSKPPPLPLTAGQASPMTQITQQEILDSFKQAVILKPSLRGPKFQITPYAQRLAEQRNEAFQRAASKKNFEAMSHRIKAMLDKVNI